MDRGQQLHGVRPWLPEQALRYREDGYWTGQTLGELLALQARARPERVALVDARRRVSYAELRRASNGLAAGFASLGIQRGDRVVVQLPNVVELFEVLFALARLGAAPVLALPSHRRFELSHFARLTEAVALVTPERLGGFDHVQLAREVMAEVASLRHVVIAAEGESAARGARTEPGHVSLDRLRLDPADARPLPEPDASDVLLLQLSGGSTGVPKLIPRTHDDYLYSVRASAELCGWSERTVYLAALPAQHNFPLSSPGVLGALSAGGRAVLCQRPTPDEFFGWVERERVTWTAVVPALLGVWMDARARAEQDLSSLEVVQVGGALLAPERARQVQPRLGCRLQQVFGMAEGLVCYTRLDDDEALVMTSQGRPLSPADEVRIVDDVDQPVPAGERGHLLVRGPYTIAGYYADEAEHALRFTQDGFYRTGDLVRQLPSGHLVVVGRSKDQINRGGDKIAAAEVEAHLTAHEAVREAAVVGLADPFLGERSCAFVVCTDLVPKAQELRAFMRGRGAADYKLPDRFEFVASLPKTGVGKVDKRALLEQLKARSAVPHEPRSES